MITSTISATGGSKQIGTGTVPVLHSQGSTTGLPWKAAPRKGRNRPLGAPAAEPVGDSIVSISTTMGQSSDDTISLFKRSPDSTPNSHIQAYVGPKGDSYVGKGHPLGYRRPYP